MRGCLPIGYVLVTIHLIRHSVQFRACGIKKNSYYDIPRVVCLLCECLLFADSKPMRFAAEAEQDMLHAKGCLELKERRSALSALTEHCASEQALGTWQSRTQ